MAEQLSNRLAVRFGPATFGLPYRFGKISYVHEWRDSELHGRVTDAATGAALQYRARLNSPIRFEPCETPAGCRRSQSPRSFVPCEFGSLTEWLMERYTAFTCRRNKGRFFRVWHPPWPQCEAEVELGDISLVKKYWPWFGQARLIGANFSPGLREVWMGRPFSADATPLYSRADHNGFRFN